jgi:hypothetical protein
MRGQAYRVTMLALYGVALAGAAPATSFTTNAPMPDFGPPLRRPAPVVTAPGAFTTAPTPNQDAGAPQTRASTDASVSPDLFSRHDQYRGEGYSPSSSAQIEQDRRVRPGAGISLRMPLQ